MSLECSDTLRLYTYVHRPGIEPGSHPWQGCILPQTIGVQERSVKDALFDEGVTVQCVYE